MFADLIDDTLDKMFEEWNAHTMRKSSKNPGGMPDFLYAHPELHGAVQSGTPIPPMFVEYCQAAFAESEVDMSNLFGLAADRPIFTAALSLHGLVPVTRDNMTTAFLYLRQIRVALHSLLP